MLHILKRTCAKGSERGRCSEEIPASRFPLRCDESGRQQSQCLGANLRIKRRKSRQAASERPTMPVVDASFVRGRNIFFFPLDCGATTAHRRQRCGTDAKPSASARCLTDWTVTLLVKHCFRDSIFINLLNESHQLLKGEEVRALKKFSVKSLQEVS